MGHLKAFFFTLKQDHGSALLWNIYIYRYIYFLETSKIRGHLGI